MAAVATAASTVVSCFDIGPDASLIGAADGEPVAGAGLSAGPEWVTGGDVVAGAAPGPASAGLTWNDRLTSGAGR
jgi:hypothetical protein